jgi:hypothetical protein
MEPNYQCSICKETFRSPEFAARCEAQGRPPLVYHVGDTLLKKSAPDSLLVVNVCRVHHGTAICPIDGPCQHAVTYSGYRIYPTYFGLERAWISGLGNSFNWQSIMPGHESIATLHFPGGLPWGVISENGPPELYLAGPRPEEGWRRLWELWDSNQPKRRGRPRKDRQLVMLKKEE